MECRVERLAGLAALIVGLAGMCACAGAGGQKAGGASKSAPEWLRTGEHADYASEAYLTGVGSGRTRRGAYASALSEIVFQVKSEIDVSYQTKTVQRIEAGSDRETQVTRNRKSVEDIQLKSSFEAADLVELAEVHRDKNGDYHALAVLEQMRARRHARRKYREIVEKHATFARRSGERLGKMRIREVAGVVSRLKKALGELQKAELMIHTFDGQIPSSSPITDVMKRARKRMLELRRRTSVQICIETEGAPGERAAAPYLRRTVSEWFAARNIDTRACDNTAGAVTDRTMRLAIETEHACDQADEIASITMCRTFGQLGLERVGQSGSVASRPLGGEISRKGHRNSQQAVRNSIDFVIDEITGTLTKVFGP